MKKTWGNENFQREGGADKCQKWMQVHSIHVKHSWTSQINQAQAGHQIDQQLVNLGTNWTEIY